MKFQHYLSKILFRTNHTSGVKFVAKKSAGVAGSKLQLEDWEYVTCMKHLYLSSEGMHRQEAQQLITSRFHILM